MESPETPIDRYRIYTHVSRIHELKSKRWVRGTAKEAEFVEESMGWYLFLEGSWEGLQVGAERPNLEVGDKVLITIRKVHNA
jgi:hypothetical protein